MQQSIGSNQLAASNRQQAIDSNQSVARNAQQSIGSNQSAAINEQQAIDNLAIARYRPVKRVANDIHSCHSDPSAAITIVRIHRHAISMAQSSTRNLQHVVIHAQSIHNHQPAMLVHAQVSTPLAQCPSSSPNPCQSIRSQIKEITTINEVMCPRDLLANKA